MIERLYPGVFVSEIPFDARPIDGVATVTDRRDLTLGVEAFARVQGDPAPEWTDANQRDPGPTLLQLHGWLGESLLHRPDGTFHHSVRQAVHARGVIAGLAASGPGAATACEVKLTTGLAIGPDGRELVADSSSSAREQPKP